jgi:hypothetical protein
MYTIPLQRTYTVDIALESPLGRAAVLGEVFDFQHINDSRPLEMIGDSPYSMINAWGQRGRRREAARSKIQQRQRQ